MTTQLQHDPARSLVRVFIIASCVLSSSAAHAQPCSPEWQPVGSGLGNNVFALSTYQNELYAGGNFTSAVGGVPFALMRVARWDGGTWMAVGPGLGGLVRSFAHLGGDLYAGGNFTNIATDPVTPASRVARWNGQAWSALGSQIINNQVFALEVYQEELYAAGNFTMLDSTPVGRILRWNSAGAGGLGEWEEVGGGTDNTINALVVFDDGSGPALYAGGSFLVAGSVSANRIARWDGQDWSAVGEGAENGLNGTVSSLATFDDGGGEALYIGGSTFTMAGTVPANRLARWNGQTWSSIGELFGSTPTASFSVDAFAVFDDGSGPALFIGGTFVTADGITVNRIARWQGDWTPLGSGIASGGVNALTVYEAPGDIPGLYAAGNFQSIGGITAPRIARWAHCPATPPCYANCDGSTIEPILNVDDFTCFINEFAIGVALPHEQQIPHYANCDGSTIAPALNVDDFTCFINAFAQGCP